MKSFIMLLRKATLILFIISSCDDLDRLWKVRMLECMCVCVCVYVCMYLCVTVKEREREREKIVWKGRVGE